DCWPQKEGNPHFREDVLVGSWDRVVSGPDGAFRLAVLPGAGHVVVQAATHDYLQRVVYHDLVTGKFTDAAPANVRRPGGEGRWFRSGLLPLDLKAGDERAEVQIPLRRGVTVKGPLAGPGGKPVAEARALVRLPIATLGYSELYPAVVCDGRFELPGCDP